MLLINGRRILKPSEVVAANYISETNVLFYDKTYVEPCGVTVPARVKDAWTWEEFIDACIKLTKDVNGKHPGEEGFDPENIEVYGIADMDAGVLAYSRGAGYFSLNGKEFWMDKPETIESIQAVADLMNVYHVAPTPTSRNAIGGKYMLVCPAAVGRANKYDDSEIERSIDSLSRVSHPRMHF